MSHETIIYGMIEGSTYTVEAYRSLQDKNAVVISSLPAEFDQYPGLSRGMFSIPPPNSMMGCFRAQVIHFGGSYKNIDAGYSDIAKWVDEFECLLRRLYWFQAVAHVETELVGTLRFDYTISEEIIASYHDGAPSVTSDWQRRFYAMGEETEFEP